MGDMAGEASHKIRTEQHIWKGQTDHPSTECTSQSRSVGAHSAKTLETGVKVKDSAETLRQILRNGVRWILVQDKQYYEAPGRWFIRILTVCVHVCMCVSVGACVCACVCAICVRPCRPALVVTFTLHKGKNAHSLKPTRDRKNGLLFEKR